MTSRDNRNSIPAGRRLASRFGDHGARKLVASAWAATLVVTAGCSSSSTAPTTQDVGQGAVETGVVSDAVAADEDGSSGFCDAYVARAKKCGTKDTDETLRSDCNAIASRTKVIVRVDATSVYNACFTDRPCAQSEEDCLAAEGLKLVLTDAGVRYRAACTGAVAKCAKDAAWSGWCADDGDTPWRFFNDATLDAYGACFAKGCGDTVASCLIEVTKKSAAGG